MYTKKGLPGRWDLVLCTVKKIEGHSVFLNLDEYGTLEAMLHSTEIERRHLRKIKSKFKPGTKLVCQVVRADKTDKHITLSQKRVGAAQNRNKLTELNNEKTADGILNFFAKENKIKNVYAEIGDKILEKYDLLFPVFLEISKGSDDLLSGLGIKKELASKLLAFVRQRLKIPKKTITVELKIKSVRGDGISAIKKAFADAAEIAKKHGVDFEANYLGAPKYRIKLTMDNYKVGEKAYEEIKESMESQLKKSAGSVEFKR